MESITNDRHAREIEAIQEELSKLQASSRVVTTPEELEKLEGEIRELTNRLGSALLGQKIEASLASEEMEEAEKELIRKHPKRLRSEGKKTLRSRPHLVRR